MALSRAILGCMLLSLLLIGCREKSRSDADSVKSLPPVFSLGPSSNTNWDVSAGPVMLVSVGSSADSAAIVLPEATDSTIGAIQGIAPPMGGLAFELFSRAGKFESPTTVLPLSSPADAKQECNAWPAAKLESPHAGWRVGFVSGNVTAIRLDSIEGLRSTDSAALAASLTQSAAALPVASDPIFRGLPFRVRSAYTFRLDSMDVVIADVIRTLNEEANPRLEHLLLIGERPAGSQGKYVLGYFSRTAGAEETIQATEVLTVVTIGLSKRAAIVVNVESDEGRKLGLIERTAPGQWRTTWESAYTDC
jgi:hypothetical protein